ncbi:hypothetical protein HDU91_005646, partial [Kappamyces sp. JEL0680]
MDNRNRILLPSEAQATLGTEKEIVLNDGEFLAREAEDAASVVDWPGYRVAVTIWTKGQIRLEPLRERISLAFQYTLVDYAIESYFRSSKWHLISPKKALPDLPLPDNSSQENTAALTVANVQT